MYFIFIAKRKSPFVNLSSINSSHSVRFLFVLLKLFPNENENFLINLLTLISLFIYSFFVNLLIFNFSFQMSGPEDAFPYNSIVRESDFRDLKETDLLDYNNEESEFDLSNLTLYDFIDEESMNKLNRNNDFPYFQPHEQITNLQNMDDMKETDLCTFDDDDESTTTTLSSKERTNSIANHSVTSHDDDWDSGQWNLDNAESVSMSTDSGIINDGGKLNLDLDDLNHLSLTHGGGVKFHDLESDFFDTDTEALDRSPTDDCFETNRGQTKDLVRFQDIESDFFETDCEGAGIEIPTSSFKFQDIESDFFDEDELSPLSLALKNKSKASEKLSQDAKNEKCQIKQQKQILTRLTSGKDKRASMTNNLLRTTIEELERALSNSNTLLVKRDQKIQDLRKRNNELKKSLSEEVESSAQMKLLLLEKEAVVSEKEATIATYQTEIDRLCQEINDLRLYKLNNIQDFSISCDPSNLDNSVETDLLGDQDNKPSCTVTTKTTNTNTSTPHRQNKHDNVSMTSSKRSFSPISSTSTPGSGSKVGTSRLSSGTISKSSSFSSPLMSPPQGGKVSNPDAVSSTELHARLQMKFMRDAFFYYMIGFHSDEQINAILAILDYGDKRQDFVLEAHKLKKSGKKFNVSKVSTRGLTFEQQVEPK